MKDSRPITAANIGEAIERRRPCLNPASVIFPEAPRDYAVGTQKTHRTRERERPIVIIAGGSNARAPR